MPNKNSRDHFIEGDRIYLRNVRLDDVNENYGRWMNDPSVNQFLETRYIPRSLDNIRSYVQNMDGKTDEIFLAICLKKGDAHIGNIKLGPINWVHRFGDISLLIGEKEQWGKGYARESISALVCFAFDVLNLNKLHAGCYASNHGSKKAFLKAGFKQEGVLEKKRLINGKFEDEILLGLHVDDWRAHRSKS